METARSLYLLPEKEFFPFECDVASKSVAPSSSEGMSPDSNLDPIPASLRALIQASLEIPSKFSVSEKALTLTLTLTPVLNLHYEKFSMHYDLGATFPQDRRRAKAMKKIFRRLAEEAASEEVVEEEEVRKGHPVSKYAEGLVQLPSPNGFPVDPSEWRCSITGESQNLWLNLGDGCITVGLINYGLSEEGEEGQDGEKEEQVSDHEQ